MEKWRGAHPAIALFVFGVACAMTFSEVSAQVATFTTQQYPCSATPTSRLISTGTADPTSPEPARMQCRSC